MFVLKQFNFLSCSSSGVVLCNQVSDARRQSAQLYIFRALHQIDLLDAIADTEISTSLVQVTVTRSSVPSSLTSLSHSITFNKRSMISSSSRGAVRASARQGSALAARSSSRRVGVLPSAVGARLAAAAPRSGLLRTAHYSTERVLALKSGKNKKDQPKVLYDATRETENCGVGLVASLKSVPSRRVVNDADEMLVRMSHRGGCGCDPASGDGAGTYCLRIVCFRAVH